MGKLVNAVGAMSGTSLDGIDVALIATDGQDVVERRAFATTPYDDAFRDRLRAAIVAARDLDDRAARPGMLAEVEAELTDRHAEAVLELVKRAGMATGEIDIVAFHGQTVLHAPERALTLQIGDGRRLAEALGTRVVYDLRAADVAAGGQGAPLTPVYHRAMAGKLGGGPSAILNIGGVANVTFIARDGSLLAFDTGPGNAPLDDWMLRHTGNAVDRDGKCAMTGCVDDAILARLMAHPYFVAEPPKSLDRNFFEAGSLVTLSVENGAATLAAFTAEAVARAAAFAPEPPGMWIVCGGGRHNRAIMAGLGERLSGAVMTAEQAGFDGDAVEAEAWAYLGVCALKGLAITFPRTTGVAEAMTGGVVTS